MNKQKPKRLCDGKTRFTTSREAHKSLNKLSDSNRDKVPCRTYFCDLCNHWHLTSKENSWI